MPCTSGWMRSLPKWKNQGNAWRRANWAERHVCDISVEFFMFHLSQQVYVLWTRQEWPGTCASNSRQNDRPSGIILNPEPEGFSAPVFCGSHVRGVVTCYGSLHTALWFDEGRWRPTFRRPPIITKPFQFFIFYLMGCFILCSISNSLHEDGATSLQAFISK